MGNTGSVKEKPFANQGVEEALEGAHVMRNQLRRRSSYDTLNFRGRATPYEYSEDNLNNM